MTTAAQSFPGVGTSERVVLNTGTRGTVLLDAHDSERVVSIELTAPEAVRLSSALIESTDHAGKSGDGHKMNTAITRIASASKKAAEVGLDEFSQQLSMLALLPLVDERTLDVLLVLTGAEAE